mgnify:CR=1 FL=1|jgi:hypothetical protein
MKYFAAIVIAALIISTAIGLVFRWDISVAQKNVYRLDRWAGAVTHCTITIQGMERAGSLQPFNLDCETK